MWMTDEELEDLRKRNEKRRAEDKQTYESFSPLEKTIVWLISLAPFIYGAIGLIYIGLKQDCIIAP